MKQFFRKGFVGVMGMFCLCTVISRVSDSFFVPQVTEETPAARKIVHRIHAEGVAEQKQEIPILTEEGILVQTVLVQEGARVKAGDVLAEFSMEALNEQTAELSEELKLLAAQQTADAQNDRMACQKQAQNVQWAKEDYENAVQEKELAVQRAADAVQQAADDIDRFEAEASNHAMTEMELDAQRTMLWKAYFAAQEAEEDAQRTGEAAVRAASRALEAARQEAETSDHAASVPLQTEYNVERLTKQLGTYEQILSDDGKLTAPCDGTVTGVFVRAGAKTADTAAFTMASAEDGIRIQAELPPDAFLQKTDMVTVGDAAFVEKNGVRSEGFFVSAIRPTTDGKTVVTIEANDTAEKIFAGDAVLVTIEKQSQTYAVTIPLSALHTEAGEQYVYVIEEQDAVLGTQLFLRKAVVNVLEKNGSYAAVAEGALHGKSRVVVSSDRYVQAGGRVRLAEP